MVCKPVAYCSTLVSCSSKVGTQCRKHMLNGILLYLALNLHWEGRSLPGNKLD